MIVSRLRIDGKKGAILYVCPEADYSFRGRERDRNMRFSRLVFAISTGLLEQIPIMGPVLGKILAEQDRARLEARVVALIGRFSQNREEPDENERTIISALHLAQAEISNQLQAVARPRRRFLYLAARRYAGPERTFEIAAQYGFLWRSYHNRKGAKIGKVDQIAVGDVIALGYRVEGSKFRLLLPLVVVKGGSETQPIDTCAFPNKPYGPFVWASDRLSDILRFDYTLDRIFGKFTGLAVRPLQTDVTSKVLDGTFDSPGPDALWPYDHATSKARVPDEVRDWMAGLGVSNSGAA
jgi:hypothetical protein